MRQIIVDMFPAEYSRYIEVFGGAGWVLFYRPMHAQFEVYNDFNSNLTTLFRMVRDEPEALISSLEFVLNSREDFELSRKLLNYYNDYDSKDHNNQEAHDNHNRNNYCKSYRSMGQCG